LRYSEVIRSVYKIELSDKLLQLVDIFFLGASHHYFRYLESVDSINKDFHSALFRRHIEALMLVVSKGHFNNAVDPSNKSFHLAQGWDLKKRIERCEFAPKPNDPTKPEHLLWFSPDEDMFLFMVPDIRYPEGERHPNDFLLPSKLSLP